MEVSNILLLAASITNSNLVQPANAALRNVDLQNVVEKDDPPFALRMLGRKGKGKGGGNNKKFKKNNNGAGPWVMDSTSSSADNMDLAAALLKIVELEAKLNECEARDEEDEGLSEIPEEDDPSFVDVGGECSKKSDCIRPDSGSVGKLYPHLINHFLSVSNDYNLKGSLLTSSFLLACPTTGRRCYTTDQFFADQVDCSESNACTVDSNNPFPQGTCTGAGQICSSVDVEVCNQPTAGTCKCSKGCSTQLLEVQTRRLGKGLGTKRDWSVEVEKEEDTPH